jgi:hypothetical protein
MGGKQVSDKFKGNSLAERRMRPSRSLLEIGMRDFMVCDQLRKMIVVVAALVETPDVEAQLLVDPSNCECEKLRGIILQAEIYAGGESLKRLGILQGRRNRAMPLLRAHK